METLKGKVSPTEYTSWACKSDEEDIKPLREKVFVQREKRVHPHKDDKILTSGMDS